MVENTKAFAYVRTSSAANVGNDKDSEIRQRQAIETYGKRAEVEIIETFRDAAVSGVDNVLDRPGFAAMLDQVAGDGVRTIIVETASRFARDLMVAEVGFKMLRDRGIDLVAADSPSAFLDNGPTSILIRTILGAVAQFEKAMLVSKLKGARDRKRRSTGQKVEGRKSHQEAHPEVVALARSLARQGSRKMSLRAISAELAAAGHFNHNGRPYAAASVAGMLERKR
jgi:DNA invertase Pin-like site-specific DNA recombinase